MTIKEWLVFLEFNNKLQLPCPSHCLKNNGASADPCCVGADEVHVHSMVLLNEVEVDTINHSPIDSEFTLWSWVIVRALASGTQCSTQCKENITCLMKPLIGKTLHQAT